MDPSAARLEQPAPGAVHVHVGAGAVMANLAPQLMLYLPYIGIFIGVLLAFEALRQVVARGEDAEAARRAREFANVVAQLLWHRGEIPRRFDTCVPAKDVRVELDNHASRVAL